MADDAKAPQQYKQPSRKGKKAWRKNVDVTEIESGLDNVRQELISGGIISEKTADEIFAVDIEGSEHVKQDLDKKHKQLRADQIITTRNSAIPAVDTRKRKSIADLAPPAKRRDGKYIPHKELQRLKDVAYGVASASHGMIAHTDPAKDPWADQTVAPPSKTENPSFLEPKRAAVAPQTLKHAPLSLSKSKRPFAAVKKPSGGKSYNPQFEDWASRLDREGQKELISETARQAEDAAYEAKMAKARAEAARLDPAEGAESEYESAWESEWEGIQSEAEESAANLRKKRPERKTPAERNKINRRKEIERQAKWEAAMRKREEQMTRIKAIAKDVKRTEAERKAKIAQIIRNEQDVIDSSDDEAEVLRREKIGRPKIPSAPLEVVLADELQDSLRALKPEGNLLQDRFRNMIVNGKVEPRRQIFQPKKAKTHLSEKWTYADWRL